MVEHLKELMPYLEGKGIQTRGFFYPLHKQPYLSHLKYRESDFPISNKAYEEGLSLPVFYNLKKEQILVADNGQVVVATIDLVTLTDERVPANYVMVDGLGVGDVQEVVLRDRQAMAEDGIFVIITVVDAQTGKVRGSPDIISRGFVYLRESKELIFETRKRIRKTVEDITQEMHPINFQYIKESLRDKIGQFLFQKTERRPMVLPVIIEV